MKALLTGGTGFIGGSLLRLLPDAVVLSRNPDAAPAKLGSARRLRWDPEAETAPAEAFADVDVVFNLAGESIAHGRWTDEKKGRIRESRLRSTRNLIAGMAALKTPPAVLVSASAVGYYGDCGNGELGEESPAGREFLAEVCAEWEDAAMAATKLGARVVCARMGLVLAQGGGALAQMLRPFRMGLGGKIGDGKQWVPWIHIEDAIQMLVFAAERPIIRGAMNAVSPNPVTNADFTRALGHALHRPTFLSVPKLALRVALGEMSEVIIASCRAFPRVAVRNGFTFRYPQLDEALAAAVGGHSSLPTTG
jgi:uncharacterized protein (TIGR01777 family)